MGRSIPIILVGLEMTKVGDARGMENSRRPQLWLVHPAWLPWGRSLSLELPVGALSDFSSAEAGPAWKPSQLPLSGAAGAVPFSPCLPGASPCWRFSSDPPVAGGEPPGSTYVAALSAVEPVAGKGQRN